MELNFESTSQKVKKVDFRTPPLGIELVINSRLIPYVNKSTSVKAYFEGMIANT